MTEYFNGLLVIATVFMIFKIMALFYFKTGQWDKYAYSAGKSTSSWPRQWGVFKVK